MSILSVALQRLMKGDDVASVWSDTKAQVEHWEAGILAKAPASVAPIINAAVSDVKQAASDLVGSTEDALPGILSAAAPVIDDIFAKAASAYLGPAIGGEISAAEVDGLNRIESWLVGQIKSAKLTHLAAVTGASAAPQEAAQPGA